MINTIIRKIKRLVGTPRSSGKHAEINPEDIFIDSTNLPGFEEHKLEGRLEKPMGEKTFLTVKILLSIMIVFLAGRMWFLSVTNGDIYAQISENNKLEETIIFANRGVIYDRNNVELATNIVKEEGARFAERYYAPIDGLSHVVGYLKYPLSDKSGRYYEEDFRGQDGIELAYDYILKGQNGLKLRETDVFGEVTSEAVVRRAEDGSPITLSLDARVTEVLYKGIRALAQDKRFLGGAGVIMDVRNGEVLAMTSYPAYDQNLLTGVVKQETIDSLINNSAKPFLNRVIGGLYTPGSILKPIIALAALNEEIITPSKQILSTGSITVPNPYDPEAPSVFKDWKAHGWTDMAEAIAVSSDTYFYAIGGGYEEQKGLGITLLDQYFNLFGLTEKTSVGLLGEVSGVIPTPEWKSRNFDGDIWRLGDTYITSIGQYGTQITPINAARFTSAIANRGYLLTPTLILDSSLNKTNKGDKIFNFNNEDWDVVHEGMREAVTYGTALGLNVPYVKAAAKTGTAEVGSGKAYVHSWSVGFWPYEEPHYAWAIIMEKGPSSNDVGATYIMRQLLDWLNINAPEYLE